MDGRCRAAVRGQDPLDPGDPLDPLDPLDPGMGSFLRLLGMKNNANENPISKLSILPCFLLVCVIDFSFSRCFTMILDACLLKSCSKAAPAALGDCGGLDQLWEALAELWETLGLLGLSYSALATRP